MLGRAMKKGKRHKTEPSRDAPPLPAPASPFHAPFQELAKALKARPLPPSSRPVTPGVTLHGGPVAARPAVSGAAAGARPVASAVTASIAPTGAGALTAPTDAAALATSMAGVARLPEAVGRVRIRRKVDLSSIDAARKEDVAALARGDGFDVTFEDRYVRARAAGVSRETLSRLEKGEFSICAHLDLHGMPLDEARRAVDDFLASQQKRGHRCVLVVTGKGKNSPGGTGVLREQVPEWLARGPSARRVLAFASARPCDGGLGALVVLMRATSSSKNRIDVEHGGGGPVGI